MNLAVVIPTTTSLVGCGIGVLTYRMVRRQNLTVGWTFERDGDRCMLVRTGGGTAFDVEVVSVHGDKVEEATLDPIDEMHPGSRRRVLRTPRQLGGFEPTYRVTWSERRPLGRKRTRTWTSALA